MTDDTIHTCSYECERPECIRAQRDELAARLTAETSNARGEVPSILDMRATGVSDRLWLVSNPDGTREIVADAEKAGRAGFAPAFGRPYREILSEILASVERSVVHWLEFQRAYMAGVTMTKGPLGGNTMRAIAFVSRAHTYTAYLGTHHKGHFLGFGGRLAKIKMADGTVHESNNVWSGMDVPPDLRKILADNATIEWES
jgi:hypothetical protein